MYIKFKVVVIYDFNRIECLVMDWIFFLLLLFWKWYVYKGGRKEKKLCFIEKYEKLLKFCKIILYVSLYYFCGLWVLILKM